MLDRAIEQNRATQVTDHLMDGYDDAAMSIHVELYGINVRINLAPLASPVLANAVPALYRASLPCRWAIPRLAA